ncbi:MAG: hypothetical protein ABR547_09705 [Halanaerobium sp.]
MLPGPVKIIKCPYCDQKFKQSTMMSGNTMGATFWTDGKREAPMLPDSITISFCGACRQYFWVDDAEVLDEAPPDSDKYLDLDYLKNLTLEQYIDAFQKIEIRSDQDKFFLLRQIWWKYNDYYRENKEAEIPQAIKKLIPDLLDKLLDNFNEENDDHFLMKGELLRELGQFKVAEKTLKKINNPEYKEVKQFIMRLVKNENSELKELEI